MLYMVQCLVKKTEHMAVIQRINNLFAVLGKFYQVGGTQQTHLMRNSGMSHTKVIGNASNAHLLVC